MRAVYRNQDQPILTRMMDKESHWGYDNGLQAIVLLLNTTTHVTSESCSIGSFKTILKTMIPTAFLFSTIGYPFILPDMIGGNVYNNEGLPS